MQPTDQIPFPLAKTRTHEVCGAGSHVFAFALAARLGQHVMWLRESWDQQQINPIGFAEFIEPADLTLCKTEHQLETLAAAEEALRSGAVALVVMTLSKPIGLTEGRRLQLAAREGKSTGLTIIPEGHGSNAAETRWRCTPVFDADTTAADSTLQRWELIKNKSGTLGVWHVRWNVASRRLVMVPPSRE
ncbi:ImuA family protein [Cognatishimia activa]|uniref:ImuA family protein n=1 Tax=Cognatishimia activa TaxID=1715691 RepID=UPI002232554B|nr:hypothetical protein [Cognatishimia activa]UZD91040.1 hypothetical protein M0D42_15970 [Cognatishimia activa]